MQILLHDLNDLDLQQKGKQVAGKNSDLEIAIKFMKKDILATQAIVQDRILALSLSNAVATDKSGLTSTRNENTAKQDRRSALALSNGKSIVHLTPTPHASTLTGVKDDAVSVSLSYLKSRKTNSDDTNHGGSSSRSIPTSRCSSGAKECVCCRENFITTLFAGTCGDEYCRDCMRQMFLKAIKDEELYPPRCCGKVLPPRIAPKVLNDEEMRAFNERKIEMTSKD